MAKNRWIVTLILEDKPDEGEQPLTSVEVEQAVHLDLEGGLSLIKEFVEKVED